MDTSSMALAAARATSAHQRRPSVPAEKGIPRIAVAGTPPQSHDAPLGPPTAVGGRVQPWLGGR